MNDKYTPILTYNNEFKTICIRHNGKLFFPEALVQKIQKEIRDLKEALGNTELEIAKLQKPRVNPSLDQALNEGDGSYRP